MDSVLISRLFRIGMFWRALYGLVRLLIGLSLLHLVGTPLIGVLTKLMSHEIAEDPHDLVFSFATHLLHLHPLEVTYFLAGYLIFWGLLDIAMAYSLLTIRLWAFPSSILLMLFFTGYELLRFFHTHSLILLGVIAIDGVIIWLVYREYTLLKP